MKKMIMLLHIFIKVVVNLYVEVRNLSIYHFGMYMLMVDILLVLKHHILIVIMIMINIVIILNFLILHHYN